MECTFTQYGLYRGQEFSKDHLKKYGRNLLEKKYKHYVPVYYEAVDKCLKLVDKQITRKDQDEYIRPCELKPAFMYECIKSEMIEVIFVFKFTFKIIDFDLFYIVLYF